MENMLSTLIKHGLIYGAGNVLTRGITLLLLPLYTQLLTSSEYGVISCFSILFLFLTSVLSFEICQAIGIYYANSETIDEKTSYISTAFWYLFIILSIFICMVIFVCKHNVIIAALFSCVVGILFNFFQAQLNWRLHTIAYTINALISSIITILFTLLLVMKYKQGILGVFLANSIGSMSGILLGYCSSSNVIRFHFSVVKLKQLLRYSVPLVPASFGYYAYLYTDLLLVKHYLGLSDAGIYGVACRLILIINLIVYPIATALPPLIYQYYQISTVKHQLELIMRLYLFTMFSIVTGFVLFGKTILHIFTAPIYYQANVLLPILAVAAFLTNIYVMLPGLVVAKKTKFIAMIHFLGASCNIVASIILIPSLGLLGAALATLVSAIVTVGCYYLFNCVYYPIAYQWSKIVKTTLFFLCVIFFANYIKIAASNMLIECMFNSLLYLVFLFVYYLLLSFSAERRQLNVYLLRSFVRLESN